MIYLTTVTPPATEPISLADAKTHLRVEHDADDTYITALIAAARQNAESHLWRTLITTTYDLQLQAWPADDVINLPRAPLQSVTSVIYTDTAGNSSTLDASTYHVSTAGAPGRITLAHGASWPSDDLRTADAIVVRFVAGYGDSSTDVPQPIVQAMLLQIGDLYENRENTVIGSGVRQLDAYPALMRPYQVRWHRWP
jgi:uncharacterized phiE125 gp8 family phage protein